MPTVREAALAMFAAQGNPEEFGRRQAVFAALTLPEVHARRTHPRDDYLTRLATFDFEGRPLDDARSSGSMPLADRSTPAT